jgi:hypothetical protein
MREKTPLRTEVLWLLGFLLVVALVSVAGFALVLLRWIAPL